MDLMLFVCCNYIYCYHCMCSHRIHRDDQSAYSFLMHNLNITNNAKCFLNKYTNTWHLKGERNGMENEWRSHNCPDV